ncbi:RelA/SpoT domain-containing protein [Roseateles sp. DAIF2]|uniref:RelA/SpoT domain-containing protein n=1 Tax=Roseateles sp. DAIF2 TaxID=2714952 RepID=UPI0018A25FD0|nr:RelA/SpoT domain-containing protein [Roseateles sp. DAIF2]QPF74998.1 RelA/SpoT domain-containing protein [Roseateles sp. DAIF2]
MSDQHAADLALAAFEERRHELSIFMKGVEGWFASHPKLTGGSTSAVHSVKSRLKDSGHLKEKILRKQAGGDPITADNLFTRVTDLAGVRVLHLYQEQARAIHAAIIDKVANQRDWVFNEPPKAYTWDPEAQGFFANMGLEVHVKDSFYTSVHYLVRPRAESPHCCEIQVRTLFEEIWGEVDHTLNYPNPTDNVACREQLRVLTKVVGAGSRLVDAIFRTAASDPTK